MSFHNNIYHDNVCNRDLSNVGLNNSNMTDILGRLSLDKQISFCSKIYYNNICNRYLDLSYFKLTDDDIVDILRCLSNQDKLPLQIRAKVVDLIGTRITINDLPDNVRNSGIKFIFN